MRLNAMFSGPVAGYCLSALLAAGIGAALYASSYVNPLKGDLGVHDPVMIKAGSTYYIYSTGRLVGAKTSTDRITWRYASSGLTAPSWVKTEVPANSGTDFWAPDIMFRDDKYWLYYSVSTFGKNTSAIGLATSPTLSSPTWTDQGVVVKSTSGNNYNCIDPAIFQDNDGKVWLTFGSFWSGIKLVECDPATGKPADSTTTFISLASHSSGIEAPYLLKWGFYYLFVSWDKCCEGVRSTYKIVAGRATSVQGPYTDRDGKAMTSGAGEVLDTGDAVRKGPGHNGIFIDNDTVFCVNHYYDANRNGASTLQIRPLYFDDGWPSFNGTITEAPTVGVTRQATGSAPNHIPDVRVVFPLSHSGIDRLSGRVFTMRGRVLPAVLPAGRRSIPQGIIIIEDSRK
ncbi:MAG: arabinan endo-1,5-alpha-L-arabinosidase [Chitinispirillaceae bacterium]|nr:arabinan endo-1,5-alpha-L-arabinosidase [Chitinispirillaceae bacterium]